MTAQERLLEQVRGAMEEYRAIERYFQDPRGTGAEDAKRWAAAAEKSARELHEALEAGSGKRSEASRAILAFCNAGRRLIEDAVRLGVPEDPALQEMAHEARRSAEELARAVERSGKSPARAVGPALAAARSAARAEQLRRASSRALGEEPNAVVALKQGALHKRFSEVAERAAEAAELIDGSGL